MKNCFPKAIALIALSLVFVLSSMTVSSQIVETNTNPQKQDNFYKIKEAKDGFYNDQNPEARKGWKQFKRWENFWAPRVFPTGEFPQAIDILKDWNQYKNNRKDIANTTQSQTWRLIGPINRPEGSNSSVRDQGIGRVNVIRFHKDAPNDLWAGAATGGVWRSVNGGASWTQFPYTEFLSLGVSDIQIAESNPQVVYVATGDVDGSASSQNYYGIGIIKTTNGGATWLPTNAYQQLEDRKLFGKMFVSPSDPNVVVATTNGGIIKTTDGGDTWTNKQTGFFIDLESKPNDPQVLYASTFSAWGGSTDIYKSSDMGNSWKRVLNLDGTARTAIEVTPADPNMIYSLSCEKTNYRFHSVWFSTDAGETWDINYSVESGLNLLGWATNGKDMTSGQGQYDLALAVSPTNKNELWVGGVNIWKSINGGLNWNIVTQWAGYGAPLVHADQHDLKFSTDGKKLYAAHDGGIDVTSDGGSSWNYLSDGMSITQFYKIGASDADPTMFIAGAQDNGTSMYKDGKWEHSLAGDGMACAIDSKDPKKLYGSIYNGDFYRSINGGDSFSKMVDQSQTNEVGAWVAPIAIDQLNPSNVYVGYNNVWRSTTSGSSGSFINLSKNYISSGSSLQNIVVAPTSSQYIYATNYQTLWASSNAGVSWKSLFTSDAAITGIAVSYDDPTVFYYTKSGFIRGNKVWKYQDGKQTNLTGSLPNVPANCIVIQNDSPNRLYIGTDVGVFFSDYDSNIWEQYGDNMPNVIVTDLKILYKTKKLVAGTWGRGLWDAPILDCNLPKPEITVVGKTQFCQGDSCVIKAEVESGNILWTNGETSKQIVVKESGNYSYVLDDGSGCTAKSALITVNVSPVSELVVILKKAPALCQGDSLVMNAIPGLKNYRWSNGVEGRLMVATTAGTYFCTAETGDGCETVSEAIEVSFHPIPDVPTIDEVEDLLISSEATKYQWYLSGEAILNATEKSYKPKSIGKYTVAVAISGDCYSMSEPYDLKVGVNDDWTRTDGKIEINPNPAKNVANIRAFVQNNVSASVTISNIAGSELLKFNEIAGNNGINRSINISEFPAGTYIITVTTTSGSFSERFIKQ